MTVATVEKPKKLSLGVKLVYGSGDWSRASYNTIKQFFYWIFLTDVVRLSPLLASFSFVISTIWDAINDPMVGSLSDNVRTKWGRRRPFLLVFSIPFALAFLLLWWRRPGNRRSSLPSMSLWHSWWRIQSRRWSLFRICH